MIRSPNGLLCQRFALLGSTALVATTLSQPASATETPDGQPQAYSTASIAPVGILEPHILISDPGTPGTALDTDVNVTGVGQMAIAYPGGGIASCTGTLINPRTVIFAAHCVNDQAPTSYGASSGGTAISFGFAANNLPALREWYFSSLNGVANPKYYQTDIANYLYNVNQVVYNSYSLEAPARQFLYGDVALATLDTPAADVPTWALLFSQLPAPSSITADGTGYNVQIVGYGQNGTGDTGANTGSDFRRRAAENILGGLTDLDTFQAFQFGMVPSGLTQNLYWIDFDDPLRGLSGASPFDYNIFRDNARMNGTTPTEGNTSKGDSGGPLILQNFSKAVVIGVLSGGYTNLFGGQPDDGYGTVSYYQPLYLYWGWVAANNPYHYVSATAGDGEWTDPRHWETALDPSYTILSDGSLTNGVPSAPGEQKDGTSGDFGQICYQESDYTDCYDANTGIEEFTTNPIGTGANTTLPTDEAATPKATPKAVTTQLNADTTLASGLPGAINFVPDNADPVRVLVTQARYFDVTLAANGTTNLSNAAITIDRLTIGTAGAHLAIADTGSLTTLIGTNQLAGMVTVNGILSSAGDYNMLGGVLLGSGQINAPYLTSVLGQFAPGTQTTAGTLTIAGNLVMSSHTGYFANLGNSGTSDLIRVIANGTSTGTAIVGGTLRLSGIGGGIVRAGSTYTILSAEGGITGTFGTTPTAISAILTPNLAYSVNAIQLQITAGSYASVIDPNSSVQSAYAHLLDVNRGHGLTGIYDTLDMQDQGTIRANLEALAPRTQTLASVISTVELDNASRFIRQRLAGLNVRNLGGTLAYYGRPDSMAANAVSAGQQGEIMAASQNPASETARKESHLPETMSGFLAGGYLDGSSLPMANAAPAGSRDRFNGWYIAGGIETELGDDAVLGIALSHTDVRGNTVAGGGAVNGALTLATIYGKREWGRYYLDGQLSAGAFHTDTRRNGSLPNLPATLQASSGALAVAGEMNVGAMFGQRVRFGPKAGLRYSHLGLGRSSETGGTAAMTFQRKAFDSVQARAGLTVEGGGKIRPSVSAAYVTDFNHHPKSFDAAFVGALPGTMQSFALAGQDRHWAELGAGVTFNKGPLAFSVSADTSIAREDIRNQAYRGSVSLKF